MIWPNVLGANGGHMVLLTRRSYINQVSRSLQDISNISCLSRSARRLCSDAATQEIQTKIGPGFHCLPKICHVWQKDFVKSWVSTIERHGLIQNFPETKFMAIRPFILVHMYWSPWNHWTISSLVHKQTAHLTLSEGRSLMARRMALATCPSWLSWNYNDRNSTQLHTVQRMRHTLKQVANTYII